MKKLVLVLVAFVVSAFTFTASAASYEPAAKLLMLTHASTSAGTPDLNVTVNWVDFDSMTECTNAAYLLQTKSSITLDINGTPVKGMLLENKVGSQGTPITYTYRCIPAGYTNSY